MVNTSKSIQEETKAAILWRLFVEFFKISLFVVGGGHAILLVADDIFGRKLKWTKEGELIERLPIFQMIPGLIAGNTAIYVGMKMAGRIGALVSLIAVALPSFIIFLCIAMGYNKLPLDNPYIENGFLGLRSSLTGVLSATIIKGWSKNVRGIYGYATIIIASILLNLCSFNTVHVLLIAMVCGIILEYVGLGNKDSNEDEAGIPLAPLSIKTKVATTLVALLLALTATLAYGKLFWIFVKFGLLCFGGGFVLIPIYVNEFVGESAPLLQLPNEEFANLIALTQMTPGPVSVNAATFFGYRIGGLGGALTSTSGLLLPGLILLTTVLASLNKWRNNRCVKGILRGVKPATIALMLTALFLFAKMSVVQITETSFSLSPIGTLLAFLSAVAILTKKLSVMATIFSSAGIAILLSLI